MISAGTVDVKSIFHWVRDFLFSNLNKQFLIFLFFTLLSGVFWLILTLNETYEYEVKIPVTVVDVPKNAVLTSEGGDTVRITLRDKGWIISSYLYGDRIDSIAIPFKNFDKGNGHGLVSATDLKRLIDQRLEASSKVVSVKPEKLTFSYNNGECKRVPVRWKGRVIPDQLFFIADTRVVPDSVEIYASREKLDSIVYVSTEPLNYVSFRDTLSVDCRLLSLPDVKVVPNRVRVTFYTDVLTEETMDGVPVQCINVPLGKVLRTFPSKVKVHFVAGVSLIRSLRPDDFVVIADYREIKDNKQEKCSLYLRGVPNGVSRASLGVRQVDYLIEEE